MSAEVPSVNSGAVPELATSVQGLVRALRRHAPNPDWDHTDHRRAFEEAAAGRALAPGVTQSPADAGGVAVEWHAPDGVAGDEVLLYLHGGGFIMGSLATTRPLASHLAMLSKRRVLVVDYTLAPGAMHPTQVGQAVACFDWLVAQGVPASDVVLAGDSAGGNLALAAAQKLRDRGDTAAAGVVLLSPLLDLRLENPSIDRNAKSDPQTPRWLLELMAGSYLGDHSPDDPAVSPALGELAGLPPMLIQVAGSEALLDDSLHLADGAQTADVAVQLQVWPGMIHVWHAFAPRLPEAVEALRAVGSWLDTLQD